MLSACFEWYVEVQNVDPFRLGVHRQCGRFAPLHGKGDHSLCDLWHRTELQSPAMWASVGCIG